MVRGAGPDTTTLTRSTIRQAVRSPIRRHTALAMTIHGANPDQSQNYAAPQSDIAPQMYSNPGADTGSDIGSDVTPDLGPDTGNVAESAPTVLLYMKDGTTFPATDYWVANGKLHYRISYGGESSIEMNQLDLQRTVDENAKRGVRFTLKPQPVPSTPAPAQTGATTTSTTI